MLSLVSTTNGVLKRNATSQLCRVLLSSTSDPPKPSTPKKDPTFRPRRQTPKALTQAPPRRHRHQTQNKPITPIDQVEYEEAMKFLRRSKETNGSIHVSDLGYDHETLLRAADYLTSQDGTTEDLVGARRALMDAWTPEQAELYKKVLEETVQEETDKGFQGWSWVEKAEAKQGKIKGLIGTPDDDEEEEDHHNFGDEEEHGTDVPQVELNEDGEEVHNDPLQKAFGDW